MSQTTTQHVKVINAYTGAKYYGKVISSTKCYITVEVKLYYQNGNSLVVRLFKREHEAMTSEEVCSLNFYLIKPEEVKL